jgi:hypothetical protein
MGQVGGRANRWVVPDKYLEEICRWLNFVDALVTAHALTLGGFVEANPVMSKAWACHPLVYGMLKFWLFGFGVWQLRPVENDSPQVDRARGWLLRAVLVLFTLLFFHHIALRVFSS